MKAIIRNRATGKTSTVTVKTTDNGLHYITARQHSRVIQKLGFGPIAATTALLVLSEAGREYAFIDQQ
jgi:ribosomal protein S28E/S33